MIVGRIRRKADGIERPLSLKPQVKLATRTIRGIDDNLTIIGDGRWVVRPLSWVRRVKSPNDAGEPENWGVIQSTAIAAAASRSTPIATHQTRTGRRSGPSVAETSMISSTGAMSRYPLPRDGFDEAGRVRIVAKRLAQALDGGVHPVFEVDERVTRPEPAAQLVSRHHAATSVQQGLENCQRLFGKIRTYTVFPDVPGLRFQFDGTDRDAR